MSFENYVKQIELQYGKISSEKLFEILWLNYIIPLQGKILYTGSGKKNIITQVTQNSLYRISSENNESIILKKDVYIIFIELLKKKKLFRTDINRLIKFRSSMISVLLGELPFVDFNIKPKICISIIS